MHEAIISDSERGGSFDPQHSDFMKGFLDRAEETTDTDDLAPEHRCGGD
jgi:hypothetical protein